MCKKITWLFSFVLLLCTNILNAQVSVRRDSVAFHETFESTSQTSADWSFTTQNGCAGIQWTYLEQAGLAALGSDKFAVYEPAGGCYTSTLISPSVTLNRKTTDDSIEIYFYYFRTTTLTSDYITLSIHNAAGNEIIETSEIYQYANTQGWSGLVWRLAYDDIEPLLNTKEFTVRFNAVSTDGMFLAIDEVKIHHIYQKELDLKLTSPTNGTTVSSGKQYNSIRWTSSVPGAKYNAQVKLEYSTDGGTNWNNIATVNGASEIYQWDVPHIKSNNVMIRIKDANDASINDISPIFSIVWPLQLTSFTSAGNTVMQGNTVPITWSSRDDVDIVNVMFSSDGGANWTIIENNLSASSGSYAWTIPAIITNNAKIRVVDASDNMLYDESAVFSIVSNKALTVLSPNGNESFMFGTTQNITWQSNNVNNINIQLTLDGNSWSNIATNQNAASGTFNWTVPKSITANAKIKITDAADVSITDESDASFSIVQNTSVEESTFTVGFSVYPNPAEKHLVVKLNQPVKNNAYVILRDLSGRILYQDVINTGNAQLNITLPQLAVGLYYFTVNSGSKTSTQKLIIR